MTRQDASPASLPLVTASETVDAIVATSKRLKGEFRLRQEFVQRWVEDRPQPGPLASLVSNGDRRGLLLYLLLVTKASAPPFDATLASTVWARALDVGGGVGTARSTISKTWGRLEELGLVQRERSGRLTNVRLLREDGSGVEYTSPGEVGDRYFRVPVALWSAGPDEVRRWYQALSLPELAVTLIGRSLGDGFLLPQEKSMAWYGISADSVGRGISGLVDHGLLDFNESYKKAPLSPTGVTAERRYTLQAPLGPVGRLSGKRAATKKTPSKKKVRTKKARAKRKKVAKKRRPANARQDQ